MKTKITELLGIEYPIVQGAMAWIAEHHLAAAVSKAGGLGIIAGGAAPVDYIRDEIRKAREITDKPLGMNIMLLSPNADDLAQLAIDEKIEVLTTGAGNPGKYMAAWKNAGIKIMPVVASVALAKRMERAGADAVIAEGMEGGGHIGELTRSLKRQPPGRCARLCRMATMRKAPSCPARSQACSGSSVRARTSSEA